VKGIEPDFPEKHFMKQVSFIETPAFLQDSLYFHDILSFWYDMILWGHVDRLA